MADLLKRELFYPKCQQGGASVYILSPMPIKSRMALLQSVWLQTLSTYIYIYMYTYILSLKSLNCVLRAPSNCIVTLWSQRIPTRRR